MLKEASSLLWKGEGAFQICMLIRRNGKLYVHTVKQRGVPAGAPTRTQSFLSLLVLTPCVSLKGVSRKKAT